MPTISVFKDTLFEALGRSYSESSDSSSKYSFSTLSVLAWLSINFMSELLALCP